MTAPWWTLALAHVALATANAILGIGSVVSKIGLSGCNPVVFAFLREMLAAPLLFGMSCTLEASSMVDLGGPQPSRVTLRDVLQFFLAGLMLFGTNLGYIVGVKLLGATPAAIWQSSLPIFTMLISVLVGYEKLSVLKVVGVLSAVAGCAFLTLFDPASGGSSGAKPAQVTGNLIFLVQVLACAAFFVAEKPLLRRFSPLATLAYSYAIASTFMIIAALVINSDVELLNIVCPDCHGVGWAVPHEAWLAIGYWVVMGSVTGYFLLTWGNLYVDASMVGVYFTVQPLAAVVAAVVVISATPPPHYHLQGPGVQDVGALAIFLGVAVLIYDAKRAASISATLPAACGHMTEPIISGTFGDGARRPIAASTSHDSVLLAVRLASAVHEERIRSGLSEEALPQYEPLAAGGGCEARPDAEAPEVTPATVSGRTSRLW